MKALLKYHIDMYMSGFHFMSPFLPVLIYSILLCLFFSVLVSSCFVYSLAILFTVCLADGFFLHRADSDDMDAVLILKLGSAIKYYLSKEVFLSLFALIYMLLILLYSAAAFLFGEIVLSKPVPAELAVLCSLHLLVALLGYELSSLFQSKMIRKRRLALMLFFITIIGIFMRQSLIRVPVLKCLFWVFPPIVKLLRIVSESETFLSSEIGWIAVQLILDILLVLVIKGVIWNKRKWTVYE